MTGWWADPEMIFFDILRSFLIFLVFDILNFRKNIFVSYYFFPETLEN